MTLSKSRLKYKLRPLVHHLKPCVLLGAKGLTPEVINEIDLALTAKELIKIKLTGISREDKTALLDGLCSQLNAELIQVMGHMASLYRENPKKPNPELLFK